MLLLFAFIFGLTIGSFLNVVILRLGKESFVKGRSKCLKCNYEIKWYDNLPIISFLLLRGKCRNCKVKISWQYPLVEFFTGLIFVLNYYFFGYSLEFIFYSIISSFLIVIFVYDLLTYFILDRVTLPAIVIALAGNIYFGADLKSLFWGVLVGAAFFAAQYLVSRGKWVGDGDIRLGALMGALLGFKYMLVALFVSYLLGATLGIVLILAKRKDLSSEVPFGPFLTLGTFISLYYGEQILNWYLKSLYLN